MDFTPFFKRYEELSVLADKTFERVKETHPECVKCGEQCADCCYAVFDLTLIEALYINHYFRINFEDRARDRLIEKADQADRRIYRVKRKANKDFERGENEAAILTQMARERIRCPLLNEKETCDLYLYRPITCRLYGIPTSIGGVGHTCGRSGFVEGGEYPTVNLDILHRRLFELSAELVQAIRSKHSKTADLLVPVSMALLTVYDEEYLGCPPIKTVDETEGEER